MVKDFKLNEKQTLEFRAQAFNFLNYKLETFSKFIPGELSRTYPATPTIELVGDGVSLDAATATISVSSPTGPLSYDVPFKILFTITPTENTPTPTGVVQFAFDGQNFRPVMLGSDGTASITFTGQNAGHHTVQAHYEGDANYASVETAVLPLSINLATAVNVLMMESII